MGRHAFSSWTLYMSSISTTVVIGRGEHLVVGG